MDRFLGKVAITLVACSLACGKKEAECAATTPSDPIHVPDGLPLTPPSGWEVQDHPSQPGKVLVMQEKKDGFAPCVNLLEDSYAGRLDDFVDLNVTNLRQLAKQYRQLKREPFQTNGGISGIKLTCTSVVNKAQLFFSYYLFDWNAESKRVFTCCSLATQSKTMEPVFDEILKTYRPE